MSSPYATPIKYGIVNAMGTDGYSIINVYSDGSESSAWAWYATYEQAHRELENTGIPIEDWTEDAE